MRWRPLPDDYHAEVFVNVSSSADAENSPTHWPVWPPRKRHCRRSPTSFNGPDSWVSCRSHQRRVRDQPYHPYSSWPRPTWTGCYLGHIMMQEGEMNEVSEAEMLEAIKFAHEEITALPRPDGTDRMVGNRNVPTRTKRTTRNCASWYG